MGPFSEMTHNDAESTLQIDDVGSSALRHGKSFPIVHVCMGDSLACYILEVQYDDSPFPRRSFGRIAVHFLIIFYLCLFF